jgi:hypothetical protein
MERSIDRKAPSTNFQAPEKFQAPNSKFPRAWMDGSLMFGASLARCGGAPALRLGAWNLELSKLTLADVQTRRPV